ncbi:MAG TPA: PspA/IM30 family protein [Candidatus Angelobacter sp.]|nr:PspA/IM30 family protein [Candidatus Angelobacter sp.]
MSLMERVATLIRANLNDLIDKAENPEKLIKQVILDMENQLLQVKTQVAIAIADQHLLEKKQKENEDKISEWNRKAELAVSKNQDDLARAAIERSLQYKQLVASFSQQVADQKLQVELLKGALNNLQQKLDEAVSKSQMLIAQHRRVRGLAKATDAHAKAGNGSNDVTFSRLERKVLRSEAVGQAKSELIAEDDLAQRMARLEKEDEINRILSQLKSKNR